MENYEQIEEAQFTVDDDAKAEWALTKIKELEEEHGRLIKVCRDMISHYQLKEQKYQEDLENKKEYFVSQLQQYFESVPHKETKTLEKYALPGGDLVLKKEAVKLISGENLTDWLRQNAPTYVETRHIPKWGEFKKNLVYTDGDETVIDGETGNVVPVDAVTIDKTPSEFKIKLK